MRMLVHKNIIRLYADVETETHFVLKMELLRGGDLFERLEKLVRERPVQGHEHEQGAGVLTCARMWRTHARQTVFNENDARAIITQVAGP